MTDRGIKLERTEDSLRRAREALARNMGKATEQDWREAVARYEERVAAVKRVERAQFHGMAPDLVQAIRTLAR